MEFKDGREIMKKFLAKVMAILIVLNLSLIPQSSAVEQSVNPTVIDMTAEQVMFRISSELAGTLYYVVTEKETSPPTASEIKALASSAVMTDVLRSSGIMMVTAGMTANFTVMGLKGGTYKLHSVMEVEGVLQTANTREFTALDYKKVPEVVSKTDDRIVVMSKFNHSGYLYYGVYTDATGITASDVIYNTNTENRVKSGFDEITNAVAKTTIISGLKGNSTYDIVFVKRDLFGNYGQTVQVIHDVQTRGNKLLNVAYTRGNVESDEDDRIYLYFQDGIEHAGSANNYEISFVNDSNVTVCTLDGMKESPDFVVLGATDNRVELQVTSGSSLYASNFSYGSMHVNVVNGGLFDPAVETGYEAATFTLSEGAYYGSDAQPMMVLANYLPLPVDGPEDDKIEITMDSEMLTTPSAINFTVALGASPSDLPINLLPNTDFVIEEKDSTSFYMALTSEGAIKLEQLALPTSLVKVSYGSEENSPINSPTYFGKYMPYIYTLRDSSVSSLSELSVYGSSVPNFSQSIYTYNVTMPYIVAEAHNSTPAAGVSAIPTSPEGYVEISYINSTQSLVEVYAADGTWSEYTVNAVPDYLTLGGIVINAKQVPNFDPYSTEFIYTLPDAVTPAPTLQVIHSTNTTAEITSVLSTTLENTYIYTVVLTKEGVQKIFTITVKCAPTTPTNPTEPTNPTNPTNPTEPTNPTNPTEPTNPTNPTNPPVNEDREDVIDYINNNPTTGGTVGPVVPPEVIFLDPARELSAFVMPMDLSNQMNFTNSINFIENAMNSIKNEQQAIETLTKMEGLVKQANTALGTQPAETKKLIEMVTNMTTGVEAKMEMIQDPVKQLAILDQFIGRVQAFKGQSSTLPNAQGIMQTSQLDKSVIELVQKTANSFGTVRLAAQVGAEPVKLDQAMLVSTIQKQTEAMVKLNALQKSYFDTGVAKEIKKEIKFVAETPTGVAVLKIELAPEQVDTLKNAKVDSFTVSNVNAEIKVPMSNVDNQKPIQLVIEKVDRPVGTLQVGEPEIVYEMSMLVNNEKQEKFSKPITLTFNLTVFKLEKESPDSLAIFKKNELTNVFEPVGGIVDPEGRKIFVNRDNTSQYTVMKSKKSFSDADQSWAKAEINALLNKGIVSDSAKFEPQSALTRGEFAQWIAKAYGLKVASTSLPFKDVAKSGDTYEAIAAVYQQGLLSGKSKTSFDPNGAVTQNEMAAALGKLMVSFNNKEKGSKVTSKYLSQLKTTQVASWAEDDMALLMELGFNATGKSGDPVTKEVAAAAFMKFYRS